MRANSHAPATAMRCGLFGGTFDPLHRGHALAAREVLQLFELDCIYFIPSALPPHKLQGPLAPARDRLEMIRRALQATSRLLVSDLEIRRAGPSYTIDTLRAFQAAPGTPQRLFFLLGLDAFLELHTWRAYRQVLDIAALIIMSRPMPRRSRLSLRETAADYARRHLSDRYQWSKEGDVLRHPVKRPLYLARVTPMDIASSYIRAQAGRGASIDRWVAPSVAQYIHSRGLYR